MSFLRDPGLALRWRKCKRNASCGCSKARKGRITGFPLRSEINKKEEKKGNKRLMN